MKINNTGKLFMCTQFLVFLLLITFTFFPEICKPESLANQHCPPSSCGNIHNISYPFRLTTDPIECGDSDYELSCETNNFTVIYLPNKYVPPKYKYYVEAINYNNYTIRVVDPNYVHHKDNCSSFPRNTLMEDDFPSGISRYSSWNYTYVSWKFLETKIRFGPVTYGLSGAEFKNVQKLTENAIFLTCEKPLKNSSLYKYIDTASCINISTLSQSKRQPYSYVIFDHYLRFSDLEESCYIHQIALSSSKNRIGSPTDIHNELVQGFELSWVGSFLKRGDDVCYVDHSKVLCLSPCYAVFPPTFEACGFLGIIIIYLRLLALYIFKAQKFIGIAVIPRGICTIIVTVVLIYKWRRRHLSMYDGYQESKYNVVL